MTEDVLHPRNKVNLKPRDGPVGDVGGSALWPTVWAVSVMVDDGFFWSNTLPAEK